MSTKPTFIDDKEIWKIIDQIYDMKDLFMASMTLKDRLVNDLKATSEAEVGFEARGSELTLWAGKPENAADQNKLIEFDRNIKRALLKKDQKSSEKPAESAIGNTTGKPSFGPEFNPHSLLSEQLETIPEMDDVEFEEDERPPKVQRKTKTPNELEIIASMDPGYERLLSNVIPVYAKHNIREKIIDIMRLYKDFNTQAKNLIVKLEEEGRKANLLPAEIANKVKNDPGYQLARNLLQALREAKDKLDKIKVVLQNKQEENYKLGFRALPQNTYLGQKSNEYEVFKYLIVESIRSEILRLKRLRKKKDETSNHTPKLRPETESNDDKEILENKHRVEGSETEFLENRKQSQFHLFEFLQAHPALTEYLKDHLQDLKSISEHYQRDKHAEKTVKNERAALTNPKEQLKTSKKEFLIQLKKDWEKLEKEAKLDATKRNAADKAKENYLSFQKRFTP